MLQEQGYDLGVQCFDSQFLYCTIFSLRNRIQQAKSLEFVLRHILSTKIQKVILKLAMSSELHIKIHHGAYPHSDTITIT